jgi:hypothetical protein
MMSGDNYHHDRVTNHDPDAFWASTGSKVWHIVMSPVNLQFDNIGWEDLEWEHASSLMTLFYQRCRAHPPVSELTKRPYKSGSLVKTFHMQALPVSLDIQESVPSLSANSWEHVFVAIKTGRKPIGAHFGKDPLSLNDVLCSIIITVIRVCRPLHIPGTLQ